MRLTMMEAIRSAVREEMRSDKRLFLIGEDVGPYGGEMGLSKGLWEEFGDDRVRDAPISEATIVGIGIGAALTGCPAIAEVPFSDFLGIAMDQICNQAAKMNYMFGGKARIPLVVRSPIGAYQRGAAQHSQSPEAWFTHVPGLKVVMPATPADAKGLMIAAIRDNSPVIFLEHKKLYHIKAEVPEGSCEIPFGAGRIAREGSNITIVATGYMVQFAEKAAEALGQEGISCEIIDPRTLVPLDEEMILASVRKTGKCIVVQEANTRGGYCAEIASMVSEKAYGSLKAPVLRVGSLNVPIPFSPVLEDAVLPNDRKIIDAVKKLF
jgi:pyruvate dehydrogenase E1 component beta subunit